MKDKKLDKIDYAILKILQNECRTSYRDIEEKSGICIATIHNRIKILKGKGIIRRNTILLNDHKLGYSITAILKIEIDNSRIDDTLNRLSSFSNICSIHQLAGKYSGMVIARFLDTNHLHNFITELNLDQSIKSLKTDIILNEVRFSPNIKINGLTNLI